MPEPGNGSRRFEVHCSGLVANSLKDLQREATQQGQGKSFLAALRTVIRRLEMDPHSVGEALYRLPVLRIEVRVHLTHPLAISFGVCEDRPLVFIREVKLLSKHPE